DGTISVGDRLLPDFPAERARLRAVKLPACLSRGLSVPRGRIFRRVEAREVCFVGKASRQRRLKQERERKQRRAAQPSASSPSGPSRPPHEPQRHDIPPRQGRGTRRDIRYEPPPQAKQPSQRELAAVGVTEAL